MSAEETRRFGQKHGSLDDRLEAVSRTLRLTRSTPILRWVGGTHPRVLELAAHADGWNGWAVTREKLVGIVSRLRAERSDVTISWGGSVVMGRDDSEVDDIVSGRNGRGGTITGTTSSVPAELRRLVDAGVDHLVVSVLPNRHQQWERFAGAVLGKLG